MTLLDRTTARTLPAYYSTESATPETKMAVVKFFNPCGAGTWYCFEALARMPDGTEKPLSGVEDLRAVEDVIFFAYVTGLGCNELGDVSLRELEAFKGRFRLGIERDLHFTPESLASIQSREG